MNSPSIPVFNERRRPDRRSCAFAVVAATIILSVTLLFPLGFDNDVYESMAWTLYAYHGLPYIASWDMNFPGIVFVHWASIALFGASDFGFRLFDFLVHIAMAAFFYRVLRHWLSPRAAIFGTLLFALYYAGGEWGLYGQRDTYASFFLLGALAWFLPLRDHEKRVDVYGFATGLFCGAALLVRPTYVFFGVSFLVLLWSAARSPRTIMLYLGGCILPLAAFLVPYAFVPNGIAQVYDSVVRFNLDVYSFVQVPVNLWSNGRAPIYLFALAGAGFALRNSSRREVLLFLLLAASAILSPIIMGKYFLYHFDPFVLLAIGFAAYTFDIVIGRRSVIWIQNVVAGGALLLFAYFYYPRHMIKLFWGKMATSSAPLEATYEASYPQPQLYGLRAQQEVINFVNRNLMADKPVEYVSLFPSLRWRLARPEATRFTTVLPIASSTIFDNVPSPGFIIDWQREFSDSIQQERPTFLITSNTNVSWPFAHATADSALHSIPGFDRMIAERYRLDTVIQGFSIYRLRT